MVTGFFASSLMILLLILAYLNLIIIEILVIFVSICLAKLQSLVLSGNRATSYIMNEDTSANQEDLERTRKSSTRQIRKMNISQYYKGRSSSSNEMYIIYCEVYQQEVDQLTESMMDVFSYVVILQTLISAYSATLSVYFFFRTISENNDTHLLFTIISILYASIVPWLYTNIGRGLDYEVREIANNK